MRNTLLLILGFVLLFSISADAQRWKRYRHEVWGGAGATNFMGELGGGDEAAKDIFLDFDAQSSRYAIAGGYRFKLNEIVSLRGGLMYGRLYGSDEFSGEIWRRSRNLTFRSPLIELTAMGEVFFIREKTSNRYRVRGIRGAIGSGLSAYFNAGLGGIYFNPRAQFNGPNGDGKWYSLHPLRTEGQGLPGGPDKYSRVNICIPVGIGMKYSINRNISLSLEYSFRFTFTDYMDDVSTSYYDRVAIADANGGLGTNEGDAAYYFSNPSIPIERKEDGVIVMAGGATKEIAIGAQRGDPTTNDSYMYVVLALNYKFTSRKTNRPKF